MPLATLLAAWSRGVDGGGAWRLALLVAALGAGVFVYTVRQVRRARWAHVDASARDERRQLNGVLLIVLGLAIGASMHAHGFSLVTRALLAAAGIIVLALCLGAWLKVSLHVAFAAFAALLPAWPLATVLLAVWAGGVAWSRRVLGRHTRIEVLIGALIGVAAGVVLRIA